MASVSTEFPKHELLSSIPLSLHLGPSDYTYSNGVYHLDMNQPLRASLIALNRLQFTPAYTTVPTGVTGTISYNGSNYALTVPTGSYSFAQLANAIYEFQLASNLYLVNSIGQAIVFINLSLSSNSQTANLTINPIPNSLPDGFTNPADLLLTGVTPTISFSSALSTLLGGFTSSPYPPTASSTSVSYNSTTVPQNVSFNYKLMMLQPRAGQRYFPTNSTPCLYQGLVPFTNTGQSVWIEPRNRSWQWFGNNGCENKISFAITNQSNLPIQLSDPLNLVIVLDFLYQDRY